MTLQDFTFISHRGNITGPDPSKENMPSYIQHALNTGFHVEIDVWVKDSMVFLGHDQPLYKIDLDFLKNEQLWCHAKNLDALKLMLDNKDTIHCFTHTNDEFTLTSRGHIWTFPGAPLSEKSIIVLPEKCGDIKDARITECKGMCSDYVWFYKMRLTAKNRIAMIISGRVKCFELDLLPQICNYYNDVSTNDTYIDIFASTNYDKHDLEILSFSRHVFPTRLCAQKYDCDTKYLTFENRRPEYKDGRYSIANAMSHFFNNKNAFHMIEEYEKENDIKFNTVFIYRTDICNPEMPDLTISLKPYNIYYPCANIYNPEWTNMEIVIGDNETMKLYCDLYDSIDQYIANENVCLHPETLVSYHINKKGIMRNIFNYVYSLDPRRKK